MKSIYVIDDDPVLQKIMLKMITNYSSDIEVLCFDDGQKGINGLVKADRLPDLIFLDINMPVMNAWQFIDAYRELQLVKVPIFILSSSIDQRDINLANSIDLVKEYLIKPMKKETLYTICDQELKNLG